MYIGKALLAIIIFLAILINPASAVFTCSVQQSACSEATIFLMDNNVNGHAATPSGSYPFRVCCQEDTPGVTVSGLCDLTNVATVLYLESLSNAHVRRFDLPGDPGYTIPVCLSSNEASVSCSYSTACNPPNVCLASISTDSNAHTGDCSAYATKICCQVSAALPNQPPSLTSIDATPFYVKQNTVITVMSIANDPNGNTIRLICGSSIHSNNFCTGTASSSNPSCSFQAPWLDDADHTIWCYVKEATTPELYESGDANDFVHSDNTPPSPDISAISNFFNQYYGQSTPTTFTTTASDSGGSGLKASRVYAGKTTPPPFARSCSSNPESCAYTTTYTNDDDDRIYYQAYAEDFVNNIAWSSIKQITLCNLTSVSVSTNCPPTGCIAGNVLTVSAVYRGQCGPQTIPFNYAQLDASAAGNECNIRRDCTGIQNCIPNGINNAGNLCVHTGYPAGTTTCDFDWTIPAVPSYCEGKTLDYDFAALYDNMGPPSGQWFDNHETPGTFKFFGDANPTISVSHAPQNPTNTDIVVVTGTGNDDIDLDLVNVSVYINDGSLLDSSRCAPPGVNTDVICILQRTYPDGTYLYNATAVDNVGHVSYSFTQSFTVASGPDLNPPVISLSVAPSEIGGLTDVDITASAVDVSGILSLSVEAFIGSTKIASQTCASSPCSIQISAQPGGTTVSYNATASDTLGNEGHEPSPFGYLTYKVCEITEASISSSCGAGGCVAGNNVNVHAVYSGSCPSIAFIQIDAESSDILCNVSQLGNMVGFNSSCITTGQDTTCDSTWPVPVVPVDCHGKSVSATFGSISKNNFPPLGEWFDSVNANGAVSFDAQPVIDIIHYPPAPDDTTTVDFNATGYDNYDIASMEIFVDNFVVPKATCMPASHPSQELNCSFTGGPYPLGTMRNYSAIITDSAGYAVQSATKNFIVGTGPDYIPPVVSVAHIPLLVGINTQINYSSISSDTRSGVKNSTLYVNASEVCFNNSALCYYTEGTLTAGLARTYYAEAFDNSGNRGVSSTQSLTVCSYDSVSLAPNCGSDSLCVEGEDVMTNAQYHGNCPDPARLQTNASDGARRCIIQSSGGSMVGINVSCSAGACNTPWPIPQVPFVCQGREISGTSSSLLSSELYDIENPTGSFRFYLDTAGVVFVISTIASDTTPNYGDTIDVNVSCYLYKIATGERSDCDNGVVIFRNITINDSINTIDYMSETSWSQFNNFNGSIWRIPINTTKYNGIVNTNNIVNVTLRFGNPANYVENSSSTSYIVNMPPAIGSIMADPDTPNIFDLVKFNSTIYNPENSTHDPFAIDKAYVCKYQNCSQKYCEMEWNGTPGSDMFNCTSTYPIQPGSNYFWIFANDTDGAENLSQRQRLLPFDEFINITIVLPDIGITVPLTQDGYPNYTRGMNVTMLITAEVRNKTNGNFIGKCDYTNCSAAFAGDPIPWDFYTNSWKASLRIKDTCNQLYNITPLIARISDGLDQFGSVIVYSDCTPRIITQPIEARVALGQYNTKIFDITVFNPYIDTSYNWIDFNMTFDGGQNSFVNNWIVFECPKDSLNCGVSTDGKSAVLRISFISNERVEVKLTSPGRAGSYPIVFRAEDKQHNQVYETRNALFIFSEALPEFELWQLLVAVAIAMVVFSLLALKKRI